MTVTNWAALCAAILIGACSGTIKTGMASEGVDARYVSGGGRLQWGDEIIALARVFEHKGKVAACGVWTVRGESTMASGTHHLFAQAGVIQMDGRNVVQGFTFMRRAAFRDDMTGTQARCVVTNTAWEPHFRPEDAVVVLPQQSYGAGEMEDTKLRFRRRALPDLVPEASAAADGAAPQG
ncbi:hypothetical protein M1105_01880 [Limibaculum sp. FT325]|uniref:hypothetical protein n=1 Tax=Thermohalobaculum sediminis TaxID=2939436 RepID=UPI0020BF1ED5|nr:hypothetical protein [Limibaculum sediminis]MCL5775747.1 hypothetical protein [Limibaculum sediminis]